MLLPRFLILCLICCMGLRGNAAPVIVESVARIAALAVDSPDHHTQPSDDSDASDPCDDEFLAADVDQADGAALVSVDAIQLPSDAVGPYCESNAGLTPLLDPLLTLQRLRI